MSPFFFVTVGCNLIHDLDVQNKLDADGDGFDAVQFGGNDCNDDDPSVYPGAPDPPYDGIDSACDGDLREWDVDGDGWEVDVDCDDEDPRVHPGAVDAWYDGIDSNCDGADDCDQDGDGYPMGGVGACVGDAVTPPFDCDDTNPNINPGAYDAWYDGIDSNCDGADDCDQDGDGFRSEKDCIGGTDCDDTNPNRYPGAPGSSLLGLILNPNDCELL